MIKRKIQYNRRLVSWAIIIKKCTMFQYWVGNFCHDVFFYRKFSTYGTVHQSLPRGKESLDNIKKVKKGIRPIRQPCIMKIQAPRLNFATRTALYSPMLYFVNGERFISNYSTRLQIPRNFRRVYIHPQGFPLTNYNEVGFSRPSLKNPWRDGWRY